MDRELVIRLVSRLRNSISDDVKGIVKVYYDCYQDAIKISISHKNLNFEPFKYCYYNFSHDILNGVPATQIANFIVKEYHYYIRNIFFD